MKRNDDKIIYISFIAATLAAALFFASVSLYSKIYVEPAVSALLDKVENNPADLHRAYLYLRDPQIFAGYKYWDSQGIPARNTLRYFDSKIYNDREIAAAEKPYLELLLSRREAGSALGLKTAAFFFLFSMVGSIAFLIYRRGEKG